MLSNIKLPNRLHKNNITIPMLFSLIFIGDYNLGGIQVGWIILLLIYTYLMILEKSSRKLILSTTILISALALFFIKMYSYFDEKYISYTFLMAGSIMPSYYLIRNIKVSPGKGHICVLMMLMFFVLGVIIKGDRGFIFGPNILYRVIIFLYVMALLVRYQSCKSVYILLLAIFVGSGLLINGSRGGILVFVVVNFLLLLKNYKAISLTIAALSLFFVSQTAMLTSVLPRAITFVDMQGSNSISDRISVYTTLPEVLSANPLGLGNAGFVTTFSYIKYPHNQILEFMIYFGWIGVAFALYLMWSIFKIKNESNHFIIAVLLFLPILFSGTLFDNYGIISILIALGLMNYPRKLSHSPIKSYGA